MSLFILEKLISQRLKLSDVAKTYEMLQNDYHSFDFVLVAARCRTVTRPRRNTTERYKLYKSRNIFLIAAIYVCESRTQQAQIFILILS